MRVLFDFRRRQRIIPDALVDRQRARHGEQKMLLPKKLLLIGSRIELGVVNQKIQGAVREPVFQFRGHSLHKFYVNLRKLLRKLRDQRRQRIGGKHIGSAD